MNPGELPVEDEKLKKYEEFWKERVEHLKPEINNLLFSWLPGETTLDEMDKIAVGLYEEIVSMWKKKNQT